MILLSVEDYVYIFCVRINIYIWSFSALGDCTIFSSNRFVVWNFGVGIPFFLENETSHAVTLPITAIDTFQLTFCGRNWNIIRSL